jgi:hypothetical protein
MESDSKLHAQELKVLVLSNAASFGSMFQKSIALFGAHLPNLVNMEK